MYTILTYSKTLGGDILSGPHLTTLEAVSKTYSKYRDMVKEGASTFNNGVVLDEVSRRVYIVSYNGKVWDVSGFDGSDADALTRALNTLGRLAYDPH